jgi:hypothetical protein
VQVATFRSKLFTIQREKLFKSALTTLSVQPTLANDGSRVGLMVYDESRNFLASDYDGQFTRSSYLFLEKNPNDGTSFQQASDLNLASILK